MLINNKAAQCDFFPVFRLNRLAPNSFKLMFEAGLSSGKVKQCGHLQNKRLHTTSIHHFVKLCYN